MRGARLALLCAVLGLAPRARASDTNYQDFLLGQRAMGMGGAFVARADDPSASWYNPAGLALMTTSSAGATISLYGLDHRTIDLGFGNPVHNADLSQFGFPIIPTTFSVMTKFGSRDEAGSRNAIGLSIFVPFSQSINFRRVEQVGGESAVYHLSESDRTLIVGPSYARRFGRDFAIGFSVFYDNRSYSRSSEVSNLLVNARAGQPCAGMPTACLLVTDIDGSVGSLLVKLGALWEVNERWRLGVAFSLPTLRLHGGSSVFSETIAASSSGQTFSAEGVDDQTSYNQRPFELRVGAAYTGPSVWDLSFDVSLHGPTTYQRVATQALIADPLFVRQVRREPVVNLNIGGELRLAPTTPLRFGAYTNFSSAPDIPDRTPDAYLTRVHMYGVSVSIGYQSRGYAVDFGVSANFGVGVAQALDPFDPTQLRRVSTSTQQVYFFVSGIGQALAKNVQRLLEGVKGL
jgi:long-chain fatty acid transport protein